MSNIIVGFSDIDGDTTYTIDSVQYKDFVACKSITHAIDLTFTVANSARTTSASTHGPIGLMHDFDKASPLLRDAAAAGETVGAVDIHRLKIEGEAVSIDETISLTGVYIVRIDVDAYVGADGLPADNMLETFWLEYSAITWDYKYKGTAVSRSWNLSTLTGT